MSGSTTDSRAEFESIVLSNPRVWGLPSGPERQAWMEREFAAWRQRGREMAAAPSLKEFEGDWGSNLSVSADEWLVEGLIPRNSYTNLYGSRSSGKSFVAIDLAYRGALGLPLFGHAIPKPFGTAIFIGEKRSTFGKRLTAWRKEYGAGHVRLQKSIWTSPKVPLLTDRSSVGLFIQYLNLVARPRMEDHGLPLDLVIIDTLARSLPGGSVSDLATATVALQNIMRIVEHAGVTVMPISHVAKGLTAHDSTAKGAGEWEDAAETVLRVERTKDPLVRRIVNTKQSDAKEATPISFTLNSVEVDLTDGTGTTWSAVVAPIEAGSEPCARQRRPLSRDAELVLTAIHDLTTAEQADDDGARSSVSISRLRETVIQAGFRADTKPDDSDKSAKRAWYDRTRKSFERTLNALAEAGRIKIVDGHVSAVD